jgi:hypothetical protein
MMTHYLLGNDYSVDWPLGTDEEGSCPPGEPMFSEDLQRQIYEWAATFNDGYSPEFGWPSKKAAELHRHQAQILIASIGRELRDGDTIELRYWETLHI